MASSTGASSPEEANNDGPALALNEARTLERNLVPHPFRPLLPIPLARLVSFTAISAHLALRFGDDMGKSGMAAAKHLLETSFALSHHLTEQIFVKLCEDLRTFPPDSPEALEQAAEDEFQKHVEKHLDQLRSDFDMAVARALAYFCLTKGSLWMLSKNSKVLLSALNQVFGATEASCAVASLLAFVREEFANPATGGTGETVGTIELGMAVVALVYLQGASRAWLRQESASLALDEIIWDVIVLANGTRADVHRSLFGGPVVPASEDGQPESDDTPPTPIAASPASPESGLRSSTASQAGEATDEAPPPGSGDGTPPRPSPSDSSLASATGAAPASPPAAPKKVGRLRWVLNTSMSVVRAAVDGINDVYALFKDTVPREAQGQPPRFAGLSRRPTLSPRQNSSGGSYFSVHGTGEHPVASMAEAPTAGGSWPTTTPGLAQMLDALRQTGQGFHGRFVERHFLSNVARFMRFASASYGPAVLNMMGIAPVQTRPIQRVSDDTDKDVYSFALHSGTLPDQVLLSSLVDPQVARDRRKLGGAAVPVVHYLSLDHDSRAVVLTCRGTLGIQELIIDFAADYEDMEWLGNTYKVHKGIYASAKHILHGGSGKVLRVLRAALQHYPGYGLVVVGHSLGGAVASLIGIMLADRGRSPRSTFVTSLEPHTNLYPNSDAMDPSVPPPEVRLPPGRPIHVYAYGPPATVSPLLRNASRGLITTIVYDDDVVPFLSLGMFHGFQGAALALKTQSTEAKQELWSRARTTLVELVTSHYRPVWARRTRAGEKREGEWAYSAIKILRASMVNDELVPPGEVFVLEDTRVAARDGGDLDKHLGTPAFRMVLRYVWEVEKRFGEVRFDSTMLLDHGPERYEKGLQRLAVGVMGGHE